MFGDSDSANSFAIDSSLKSYTDFMVLSYNEGTYKCMFDLIDYDTSCSYIIYNEDIDAYEIDSTGGLLLGKMSFRLLENAKVTDSTFALLR